MKEGKKGKLYSTAMINYFTEVTMKKIIAGLLAMAMSALVLAGCGCTRNEVMDPSSVPTLPDIISSVPMPPVPDEFISSDHEYFDNSSVPGPLAPTMGVDFSKIDSLPKAPVTWGPGTRMNAENRSEACVALQERYKDLGAYFIMPKEEKIYLTFDQGYENGFTPKILDTLKEKDVKAVFFITGHYAKSAPDLVQRMIDEGHIIGNHGMNHKNHSTCSLKDAYDDASALHDYVKENFNYEMTLFRYPEGAFNEQTLGMYQQMGYIPCFWSFAYADWDPKNQMSGEKAMEKLTAGLQPGSIVLMHTVGATNAEILGQFIDVAREKGYSVEQLNPEKVSPKE